MASSGYLKIEFSTAVFPREASTYTSSPFAFFIAIGFSGRLVGFGAGLAGAGFHDGIGGNCGFGGVLGLPPIPPITSSRTHPSTASAV